MADDASVARPFGGRWFWVFLGALGVLTLVSPAFGPTRIPDELVFRILAHQLTHGAVFPDACGAGTLPSQCRTFTLIVWQLRMPSVLLAVGVGAALGISGGTLQGVFRNPLADPYLLGISSGGTLGAVVVFVLYFGSREITGELPLFAFMGSVGTGLIILAIAWGRAGSVETLLLAGVALSSLLSAIVAYLLLYNQQGSQQVYDWLLGSVGFATWTQIGIVLSVLLVAAFLIVLHARELNLLQLGHEVAQSAGVDARATRIRLILLASVTTAIAVAFAGIIGFVGLVSPHVVRRLVSSDYRVVLLGSLVVGAAFLLVAWDVDLFFSELPIGIFTSLAGVPFFLYILFRQGRRSTMGAT
jgi:iron complex transport system permease protein